MTELTVEMEKEDIKTPEVVERTRPRRIFVPRADIFENEDSVVLLADMPGVDQENLDIMVEKDLLTIRGQVEDISREGYKSAHAEYRIGDYSRSFKLSEKVDREQIEAVLRNGILTITLPKHQEEQVISRRIEIKSG